MTRRVLLPNSQVALTNAQLQALQNEAHRLPVDKRRDLITRVEGWLRIRASSTEPRDGEVGAAVQRALHGLVRGGEVG